MQEVKRHAPFWLLIYLVWTYIKSDGGENLGFFLMLNLFNLGAYIIAFYSLKHIYMPLLFNQGKYLLFLLSIVLTSFLLYLFLFINDISWIHELGGWDVYSITLSHYLQKAIQFYSPAMVLLAWESHIKSVNAQKRFQELQNEKLATELKYLKAQLNPHFLFNTLNNLYAQVVTESGKAPEMILQLSGILDYVLYKSQKDTVPLKEEVSIIEHFLALEKVRYGDRLELALDVGGNLAVPISPLLILSLVENAFKHGVRKGIEQAIVKIEIKENNGVVFCKVWNTKSDFHEIKRDDHRKELGLSNIKRQLSISYPDTHTIQIDEKEKSFCVVVTIKTAA